MKLDELGKGIKPGVNRNEAYLLVASLPPLAEQQRIVAKVDELMVLCDQLEQQQTDSDATQHTLLQTLLATLTNAADHNEFSKAWQRLANHFDTLFTTEMSIDQLKQTILQLAVMGKLVPQDPNDEPASILLKKLTTKRDDWLELNAKKNKECTVMQKKLKKLKLAKPPFDIPADWVCAHLLQVTRMLVDCHNKTAPYVEKGIPIIRTSNIRERKFYMYNLKRVNKETYDYWSRRCPPEPQDIIFTREAPMGEAAIIPENEKYCLGQRTMLIRTMHEFISNKYLLLTLTEPSLLERASEYAIGSTVKHLRVGDVEKLNIPIPPLAEQHRIVAKVDELMALCDTLKDRLTEAQTTQLQLADTVTALVAV
jgi:type I restriction enzyme S subunit